MAADIAVIDALVARASGGTLLDALEAAELDDLAVTLIRNPMVLERLQVFVAVEDLRRDLRSGPEIATMAIAHAVTRAMDLGAAFALCPTRLASTHTLHHLRCDRLDDDTCVMDLRMPEMWAEIADRLQLDVKVPAPSHP